MTHKVQKAKVKVKVSKRVSELLDELTYSAIWDKEDIIESHIEGWNSERRKPLNDLSLEEMTTAIFVGYEIEEQVKFPEEVSEGEVNQLVAVFNKHKNSPMFSYGDGVKDGIIRTLAHLNIQVKGINK